MNTQSFFQSPGIDVAGAMAKGNEARMQAQKVQENDQAMADKQAIRELSQIPGVDFTSAKGMGEFIGHLKGRVQPDTIMKMVEMKNKMEEAETQKVLRLAKMGDEERQRYTDTQDMVMSAFDGLDKIQDPAERTKTLNERLDKFSSQTLPNGQPMYTPKAIEALKAMPWEQQQSIYKGSKHAKELLARAKDEAAVNRSNALTDQLKEGKVENWVGQDGAPLLRYPSGKWAKVDTESGEITPLPAMPAGAYKAGTKNPTAQAKVGEDATLTPEENAWIADYQQTTGKQIPGIPAGSGAAARAARIAFMKAFVKLGQDRGYTGDEAGLAALQRDASREGLKSLTTNNAKIVAGEKDLMNVAEVIKDELQKLGGPDSPLVRKYWNKASTEWMGDPQFAGLNAAMVNYQETAARVFSGQTGAGGTPVSYLHLAEQAIGKNPTLEQFTNLDQTMTKLFKAREDSTRGALAMLREGMSLHPKEGSVAGKAGNEMTEQEAREQLKFAREKARSTTDPEQKRMAEQVVRELEGKLNALGNKDGEKPAPVSEDRKAELRKRYNLGAPK